MQQHVPTPLNKQQCAKAGAWMRQHFANNIAAATHDIPTPDEIVIAMACQETGNKWLNWIDHYPPDVILARCIGDTSGEPEFPNAKRSAFPQNRSVFDLHYGHEFTKLLVDEANLMRAMPQSGATDGWSAKPFLYKAYGLLAYDIGNVVDDIAFFEQKLWYSIDDTLDRYVKIIKRKLSISTIPEKYIALYNGSGPKAVVYAKSVLQMAEWV